MQSDDFNFKVIVSCALIIVFFFIIMTVTRVNGGSRIFTFPPNTNLDEANWQYVLEIEYMTHAAGSFYDKTNKMVNIIITDRNKRRYLFDKFEFKNCAGIETKVEWDRFENIKISLFEEFVVYYDFSPNDFRGGLTTAGLLQEIEKSGIKLPDGKSDIEKLNNLLKRRGLYKEFVGLNLPKNVVDLISKESNLEVTKLMHLNRIIIEEAYPGKCPKSLRIRDEDATDSSLKREYLIETALDKLSYLEYEFNPAKRIFERVRFEK